MAAMRQSRYCSVSQNTLYTIIGHTQAEVESEMRQVRAANHGQRVHFLHPHLLPSGQYQADGVGISAEFV